MPVDRADSLSAVNVFLRDCICFKQPPAYCAMCRVAACSRIAHGTFDFDWKCDHAGGAAAAHSGLTFREFLQTDSSSWMPLCSGKLVESQSLYMVLRNTEAPVKLSAMRVLSACVPL